MKRHVVIIGIIIFVIIGLIVLTKHSKPGDKSKGLVAFVIDDWGYNRKNLDLVFQIDRPITVSILPNLRYSHDIATEVRKNGKIHDIILHLPMESKVNRAVEANTIRSGMKKNEILSILEKDIRNVVGLIGVSNHQGSKATEDESVMNIILTELKQRKLFFLDSLTTPNSVSLDVARSIGLKCAERDVFLDITDQTDFKNFESYIKKQIQELSYIATQKGSAIGIGHNEKITLQVIKDSIPELEAKGIKIVPLKELVK
ncbi:divergent polysaccharide deacetylase family protein [Candidatus Omnitrophota bacterium]